MVSPRVPIRATIPLDLLKKVEAHLREGRGLAELLLSVKSDVRSRILIEDVSMEVLVYELEPPLELPEPLPRIMSRGFGEEVPKRVKEVIVSLELAVKVKGDDGAANLSFVTDVDVAGLFILWLLMKRHYGIDFLEDIIRKKREALERLRRLKAALEEVKVVCEVMA
ncbi:MAG: hypothetical protein QW230_02550 [Thermofilum sp.]